MLKTAGRLAAFVDQDRLWSRHMALARIGAFGQTGVNRPALSALDGKARRQLVDWGRAIGLAASVDPIANLFLELRGDHPDLAPILIGSHLDSQPTGGRFDGVFGVLAALEVMEALVAAGVPPRRTVILVAWTNEEGSRFAPGMMGSAAFAGARALEPILELRDAEGISVKEALAALAAAEDDLPCRPLGFRPAAYIEPHIEQGPILEAAGNTIGIVSGIQGKRTFRVTIDGAEAHAGTEPHASRRDALLAAVEVVSALSRHFRDPEDITRFTVGRFTVTPNAPSVVPSRVVFSIDLRHPDAATLQALGDAIADISRANAGRCDVMVEALLHDPPLTFAPRLRDKMAGFAETLGLRFQHMASGAGHDARHLARLGPAAMIFVPCKDGISHNEAESALPGDLHAGAQVLAETVEWLVQASNVDIEELAT